MKGKKRCRLHGGASTGPRTLKGRIKSAVGPLKHGARSKFLRSVFSRDERKLYNKVMRALNEDEYNAADEILKDQIATAVVAIQRLVRAGKDPSRLQSELRGLLKDHKISRVGREGEEVNLRIDIEERLKRWLKPRENTKP
jgi:hypothetical protein